MINFIKKLFGFGNTDSGSSTSDASEAPYKLEPPTLGDIPVIHEVVVPAVESKPAKKTATKKPAAATATKKTAATKPAVKKPAAKTAKKPTATKTTKTK